MSEKEGKVITSTVTTSLSYEDAHKAIQWLTEVLGFQVGSMYENPRGGVAFAELVWRTGVVFVSDRAPSDSPWANVGPVSIALAAEDSETVDRFYDKAIAAGADIVRPLHDAKTAAFPEGSHQFDLRDPGGNLWTVGTFQPRVTLP